MPVTTRPVIQGRRGVVTAGHYLAAEAGLRMMHEGGNAIDAAAAMCFCVNLLEPQSNGIGGEVPTLIYSARDKKAYAVSGMGFSPKGFNIDWCRENGIDLIPGDGYLPACVPAVVDTWALAVSRFGTMTFSQVLRPAIELAEKGFPVYAGLHRALKASRKKFTEKYPSTGEVYIPRGRVPQPGEMLRNPDWAGVLKTMCRAEKRSRGSRRAGIKAARDAFYKGSIAEKILRFIETPVEDASGSAHAGLLSAEDMAAWRARVEKPVSVNYRGLTVNKCSSWTQGPVFCQQLAILEGFDLAKMGHNSSRYIHTWIECAKLAFADREAYYGDPDFDGPPFGTLLSKRYAAARREMIGRRASKEMRPGRAGRGGGAPECDLARVLIDNRRALRVRAREVKDLGLGHAHMGDTTHLDAVDAAGNMVAATPSGGWIGTSPVIRGLGFPLGTRGQMFYLNRERPNALEPRKRPRATLTPSLVTKRGRPWMVFGTPGGDCQDQWTLQFFLNHVDFGMDLAEAVDAPSFHSLHFPSSFYPRKGFPGRMVCEEGIPAKVVSELRRRGHVVRRTGRWANGKVMGIRFDSARGVISGAASPKGQIGYAMGW